MFRFRRRPPSCRERIAEIAARTSIALDDRVGAGAATNEGMPEWWVENGNMLIAASPTKVSILLHPGKKPPTNAIVVLEKGAAAPPLMLWGDAPFVLLGRNAQVPRGVICCGGRSAVYICDHVACNGRARVDARNEGVIFVGSHGLWADEVLINTDDMHRIFDVETGKRLNAFGSVVRIEDHVWLGQEVAVNPGASIGRDSVIGRRSIVIGDIPANSLAVGAPARVVRAGINWSVHDVPD